MDIVRVNNITKRFNDKLVLDNISFSVKKGEIFGLIGPNGAGHYVKMVHNGIEYADMQLIAESYTMKYNYKSYVTK